ncbi:uncharacterized protein LOC113238254 [Hyposmocoma kahamanoa]|uniref:uncharacterized protein LOC113238254 n=1 Tax=Hyposmocoma kahamanoa TaxID=1477025 RepID=UPI000E6D6C39|nr:uncharacterized protein LOC113238254 [Hyposmocoma kahamanoa]
MHAFRESENYHALHAHMITTKSSTHEGGDLESWRRACGCLKTSEKLRRIINSFPSPPPPTPKESPFFNNPQSESSSKIYMSHCMPHCLHLQTQSGPLYESSSAQPLPPTRDAQSIKEECVPEEKKDQVESQCRAWRILVEITSLIQLSVTATALALYYFIYCYMQLVYFTLRSALYFHHADGPMKITIAVVTVTSVVVGSNLLLRLERILGYIPESKIDTYTVGYDPSV